MEHRWRQVAVVVLLGMTVGCGSTAPPPGSAGQYAMTGVVTGSDGAPLVYASVALTGSPLGSVTDRSGRFAIDRIRSGSYGFTVIYLGYRSSPYPIRMEATEERTVTLDMRRDPALGEAQVDSLASVSVSYRIDGHP